MNIDTTRIHQAAYPLPLRAHVPQPPDPDIDPNMPPSIPPDAPDEVDLPVDLPTREDSPDIEEPEKPGRERVRSSGQRVVFDRRV